MTRRPSPERNEAISPGSVVRATRSGKAGYYSSVITLTGEELDGMWADGVWGPGPQALRQ